MRYFLKNCRCQDLNTYARDILKKKIKASNELIRQYELVKKEFEKGQIEVDLEQYEKYIKIGFLFFPVIFDWQRAATALALCTYHKGTHKPRWNKVMIMTGRGSGKDGMIAWWSCCLTSTYNNIPRYDVDIIANNFTQSLRPIQDIEDMCMEHKAKMKNFYKRVGDSIISLKTNSYITARSSDATQQDGLRSGCIIFNEIHAYQNYAKMNVMKSGLGKKPYPRTFYFTTNGEVRGAVIDDILEKANLVLQGHKHDKGNLFLLYKLNDKKEVHLKKNWIMANPSLKYMDSLQTEIEDEYEDWSQNPNAFPAFLQKRFNLPEIPQDQEVVPWELIEKTNQPYDTERLKGMTCIVGIDLSKTTDWTAVNFLFYDEDLDKFVCVNHSFICAHSRDLQGIKAPYQEWCNKGFGTIVDEKEIRPDFVISYVQALAQENDYNIEYIVIDDFKKGIMKNALEEAGYSKEKENLEIVRPLKIAPLVPIIESCFIQEKLIWLNNRMLMWACNNTKVIPWKVKTTGDSDLGNQLYGKINPHYRKTDPFMAFVHSMVMADHLTNIDQHYTERIRGFI